MFAGDKDGYDKNLRIDGSNGVRRLAGVWQDAEVGKFAEGHRPSGGAYAKLVD